jgi:hypothetical protein
MTPRRPGIAGGRTAALILSVTCFARFGQFPLLAFIDLSTICASYLHLWDMHQELSFGVVFHAE